MASPKGGIQVTGIKNVTRALGQAVDRWEKAAVDATNEIIADVFRQSQQEVPFEEGTLQSSGRWESPTKQAGGTIMGSIHYGGSDSPAGAYAVAQHENRDYVHHRPGTKAHYLRDPAEDHRPLLRKAIEREIKRIT